MPCPTSTILVPRDSAKESTITTTLVVFDSQVADLHLLHKSLLPGSIAHTIKPNQDPIDHITNLLTQTGATKLAIVAHGQPGAIEIGNGKIDRAMLEARSGLLQEWGLDSIALYSCEVGTDDAFINRFAELTGAQISASTSKIGAGNWELAGGMELLEIDQLADYNGTLATFNGTQASDSANASGFTYLVGFTAGTANDIALLTDADGDTFKGGDGSDYVFAGIGDDNLSGGDGDDYLNGSDGNDYIVGGSGSNTLSGGAGDDGIISSMSDIVDGGSGHDVMSVSTTSSTDAYTVEFTGTNAGKFKINGIQTGTFTGIEKVYFYGYDGNDVINASLANLSGAPIGTAAGSGTFGLNVYSYTGSDTVLGSASSDYINGGTGNDFLYGNAGSDTIYGGSDLDIIFGQAGDDTLNGEGGNDTILGGVGIDLIYGGTGTDVLYGDEDNDTIDGGDATDFLFGQAGDDTLNGDAGNDYIFGGLDNDIINGGAGTDEIYGEDGNDYILGGDDNDFLFGQAGLDSMYGEAGNDYIVGGDGDDSIGGGDGSDQINGENGVDFVLGGNGDDFIYGNVGNDTLYGDYGNDFLDGGDGNDFLDGGAGIDVLFGVEGDDQLYGGIGNDYLYGGNDNDQLYGDIGTDFLIGGAGSDKFQYFSIDEAGDIITDFNAGAGGDSLELSSLFSLLGVPSGAVNNTYLQFAPSGTSTLVRVDPDGIGAASFVTVATLNNVISTQLSFAAGGNVFV
jgi:Ca2+-binding RTX toxin-like protein